MSKKKKRSKLARRHDRLQKTPNSQIQFHAERRIAWTSPTLPPEELAKFEAIMPGAAERFLDYMDREQLDRHEERRSECANDHERRITTVKLISNMHRNTLILSIIGIGAGSACILAGQATGLVIVIPAVVPLLQAIWNRGKNPSTDTGSSETGMIDIKK